MEASATGTVRIRRSWTEELVWLAISISIAAYAIVAFDQRHLLWMSPLWMAAFVGYNRMLGVDLTPTAAVVRRPYRRSRTLRREEISGVAVERGFVTFRDAANRPVKLSVMNAVGRWGHERSERTQRQIEQWLHERPSFALAQMPGSASI